MYLLTITYNNPFSGDIEFEVRIVPSTYKVDSSWEETMDLHKLCEFLAGNYEDEKATIKLSMPDEDIKVIDEYFKTVMM